MSNSQLKSTIRGRRMYSKDYDVKIVSSKLSDIFKSEKLKHDWSNCKEAQQFIEQIQATAQLERVQSFICEAEETIWISDEHATLEIKSFSAVMDDGETQMVFDVTKFPHNFTEYHNPYDCADEEEEEVLYEYQIIKYTSYSVPHYAFMTEENNKNKILFKDGKSVTVPCDILHENLYVYCAELDKYYCINLHETNIGGHKQTPCKMGSFNVTYINDTSQLQRSSGGGEYMFKSCNLMSLMKRSKIELEFYQKANENIKYPLLHYFEDGGDEMYPCGYAYVSESFKQQNKGK